MLPLRSLSLIGALVVSTSAVAQSAPQSRTADLMDALRMPELLEIMRQEGLNYGDQIADDMFPGRATGQWLSIVSDIYDVDVMYEEIYAAMSEELADDNVDAMIAFYAAEPGRSIAALEVSAREALLDDTVEEASKEDAAIAAADATDRYQMVSEFVDANDLIEINVVGALNSQYAFYMGLMDGGAMPTEMTADMALADVWAQEGQIRQSTEEWVYSFLLMAYDPLPDEDFEALIAFSKTEAGQDMNNALMIAFNGMFDDISRALGLASSRMLTSQEL